ncbi:MAG: enoyl-CoA hydratase/isomerase family protein [Chloroflexi bacterium]|nr:enoyl-CoA hydratase/isomerase family protein [Chloroflexota bacterium]
MNEPVVLYDKSGAVADIVLNRPRVMNAYNVQMRDELFITLEAVRDDPDVRVAIISGAGERAFCAGADLTEFGTAPSQVIARQVRWERDIWGLFLSLGKPLVAAMRGYVIGSGVEIACLCDIRIAADDAQFAMPEVALGMIPAAGGTQTLRRVVGASRALEMVLSNRRIGADEAQRIGLAHSVVPADTLMQEAIAAAQELAALDPSAMSLAKRAILEGADMPLAQGLALERRLASLKVT